MSNSRGGSSGLQAEFICLANAAAWCCRADGMLLPVWAAGADAAVLGSTAGGTVAGQQQQQQFPEAAGCAELPMVWLQVRTNASGECICFTDGRLTPTISMSPLLKCFDVRILCAC